MIKKEVFKNYDTICYMCNGDEDLAVDVSLMLMSPLYDEVDHLSMSTIQNCINLLLHSHTYEENMKDEELEEECSKDCSKCCNCSKDDEDDCFGRNVIKIYKLFPQNGKGIHITDESSHIDDLIEAILKNEVK